MVKAGLKPLVKKLLDDGANPDALGHKGRTALHAAALNGDLDIVHLLLATGASVRGSGAIEFNSVEHNETPLAAAAANGNIDIVRILIAAEKGNLIHKEDMIYLGKALYCAAENDHEDCVSLLLENGAVMTVSSGRQETAVHAALFSRNLRLIPHFLERDPEIVRFNSGKTLLSMAISCESVEVVEMLLKGGANAEELDNREYSVSIIKSSFLDFKLQLSNKSLFLVFTLHWEFC